MHRDIQNKANSFTVKFELSLSGCPSAYTVHVARSQYGGLCTMRLEATKGPFTVVLIWHGMICVFRLQKMMR